MLQPHRSLYCIPCLCPQRFSRPFISSHFPIWHTVENAAMEAGCAGAAGLCVRSVCENIWGHKRNSAAQRQSFSFSILVNYGLPRFSPSEIPFVLSTTMLLSVSHSALTGDKWSVSWFTTLTLLGMVYRAGPDLFLKAKQISLLIFCSQGAALWQSTGAGASPFPLQG